MAKTAPQAHTDNVVHGMGDYYGTSIKAKIGKNRSSFMGNPVPPKKLKKPPKSIA